MVMLIADLMWCMYYEGRNRDCEEHSNSYPNACPMVLTESAPTNLQRMEMNRELMLGVFRE